jgi:hypothetical protein
MFLAIQVLTVFLASVTMALSLAHALELPGKLRLDRETYCAVQPIYYPGFTLGGGCGEGLGLIASLALLLLTPSRSAAFPWAVIGFAGLAATHATYWLLTHPVNGFWLKDRDLRGFSSKFFRFDPLGRAGYAAPAQGDVWTGLRDRWEYSHVLRAFPSMVALISLSVAVAIK